MQRDRRLLGLDQRALDRVGLLAHARGHALDQFLEPAAGFVLERVLAWAPDVEAVASRPDQAVDPRELLHHPPVAPADHAHRAAFGQPAHRVAHALGDHRVLGTIDHRGQRPVVVEQGRRTAPAERPAQLPAVAQGVRQPANARRWSRSR
jgi:hypothetical protein